MKSFLSSVYPLLAVAALLAQSRAVRGADQYEIRDYAKDARVAWVHDKDVSDGANDKILLRLEPGRNAITDPDGKTLLYLDGDITNAYSVRSPDDKRIRLAVMEKKDLRRSMTGKVLMHYGDRELCPDAASNRTHVVKGNDLRDRMTPLQTVALIYLLKPDLFKITDAERKEQLADIESTAKEEEMRIANRLFGKFTLIGGNANWQGMAAITKVGPYFHVGFDFADKIKWQGLAVPVLGPDIESQQLCVACSADGAVGLAVYEVEDGALNGVWYPVSVLKDGKEGTGTEKLKGKTASNNLNGVFDIVEAKALKTGAAYAGKLTLKKFDGDSRDVNKYEMTWKIGDINVKGVGILIEAFKKKRYLVASAGVGDLIVGQVTSNKTGLATFTFAAVGTKKLTRNLNAGNIALSQD